MEKKDLYGLKKNKEVIELPAGFRFHPSDEELITHYLSPKVIDSSFNSIAIGDVDLNRVEPWDLPWMAKIGEKEWYFFSLRDRKYPTGMRTNRATVAGYWKATGKDRDIHRSKALIGMKKTLVFYRGRAPRGEKTNWVMHEYRLHGKDSMKSPTKASKSEWVICRVFLKASNGKKADISGIIRSSRDRYCNNNEDSLRTESSSKEHLNPRTEVDPREQGFNCGNQLQLPFMLSQTSNTDSRVKVDNLSCEENPMAGLLQENEGSTLKQNHGVSLMEDVGLKYWDGLDCLWDY